MIRVATYVRVSTADQHVENQASELRRYVEARGCVLAREFADAGVSGSVQSRPGLDELLREAKRRRFDAVLVWSLDRLGRNLKHLITLLPHYRHEKVVEVEVADPRGEEFINPASAVKDGAGNYVHPPLDERLRTVAENQAEDGFGVNREESLLQLQRRQANGLWNVAVQMKPPAERVEAAQVAVARDGLDASIAQVHHELLQVGATDGGASTRVRGQRGPPAQEHTHTLRYHSAVLGVTLWR